MSDLDTFHRNTDSVSYPNQRLPFHQDPNWVEAPGCIWTPQLEEALMPSRFPTVGEKAETASHRGAIEGDYEPTEEELQAADEFAVLADDMDIVDIALYLGETLRVEEEDIPFGD